MAILLISGWLTPALAANEQDNQPRRGRGRLVGAIVGAAGGFALGLFGGLSWFDDAVNSERKIWTTALGLAAAGGAGGYFIGRSIDGRSRQQRTGANAAVPSGALRVRQLGRTAAAPVARPFANLFTVASAAPHSRTAEAARTPGVQQSKGQYP